MTDPQHLRRRFLFAHAIVREIHRVGDVYRLTFGECLRHHRELMPMYSRLLLEADRVMRARLQWMRRRKLLPAAAPRPRLRDLVIDMFAPVPSIMPAPS